MKLWTMVNVAPDEAFLFLECGVVVCIARPGCRRWGMVVVAPFCEMVCEFEAWGVGGGVFEIDDYELFVLV